MQRAVSIIIAIYNEEQYLHQQIEPLVVFCRTKKYRFEIILIENGSTDATVKIARDEARRHSEIRVFHLKQAIYGEAIREGIAKARFPVIMQFDIDWIDTVFLEAALGDIQKGVGIVIGSKLHKKSSDRRLFLRKFISRLAGGLLHMFFPFPFTDTHGIKAYRKDAIVSFLPLIASSHHFFDTELILRAYYHGIRIKERPVILTELRSTRFSTSLRIIRTIREICRLVTSVKQDIAWRQKKIFLHYDDYGYKPVRAVPQVFSSFSLIPNGSCIPRIKTSHQVMTHINLTEGRPLSKPSTIPSLIDRQGVFFPLVVFFLRLIAGRIRKKDIMQEIDVQIKSIQNRGYEVIGIDSHQHVHALALVAEACSCVANQYNIPITRSYAHVKTYTFLAAYKKAIVILGALTSSIFLSKTFRLPLTWHIKGEDFCLLSWESSDFVPPFLKNGKNLTVVTHPFLGYDNNTYYEKLQ